MNYDRNGEINGIEWSVNYLGGRRFQLTVGYLSEIYTTTYPMIFGMDIADINAINRKLDEMQEIVKSR